MEKHNERKRKTEKEKVREREKERNGKNIKYEKQFQWIFAIVFVDIIVCI